MALYNGRDLNNLGNIPEPGATNTNTGGNANSGGNTNQCGNTNNGGNTQDSVNEIKTNFFSMLERINNATILM